MIMKQMRFSVIFVFLLASFGGVVCAHAAGPWKWMFSLRNIEGENSVKLPTSVYVDEVRERYYITDAGSGSLHSYDNGGKYLNTFKPGSTLDQPVSMVRDKDGILWVVEKGRNSLTMIDLKAKKIEPASLFSSGKEVFPEAIIEHDGAFLILDKFSGEVVAFNKELESVNTFSCKDCSEGFIDFVVKDDVVFALARKEKTVYKYNTNGKFIGSIVLKSGLAFPYSIEVGASGLLFILDRHERSVFVFDQSGEFKYRFLEQGHERGNLYYPEDLLFDPWGRLCIVDAGNGRAEVFSR